MPRIFSILRDILDDSREMRLLSDSHGYTLSRLESSAPQLPLRLPEVLAPAQYLIDVGLRPALARRLSSTYMDFVDRYRKTCQSHFDHATRGGHLTEYHREVFTVLFRRTTRTWGSQIVSIVRVQLCQGGTSQATICPERVDASTAVTSEAPCNAKSFIVQIRVDDASKAEIIARLGLKAMPTTSDIVRLLTLLLSRARPKLRQAVAGLIANRASRVEEVFEQTDVLSTTPAKSYSMVWSYFEFRT